MKIKDFLSARFSERSTAASLASLFLGVAVTLFPEHASTIGMIGMILGVGAAVPTGGQPK
jgi:hypothetical protein